MKVVKIEWQFSGEVALTEFRDYNSEYELGDQVGYDELCGFIGGPLEFIKAGPYEGYCHEEGKLDELPINKSATARYVQYNGQVDVLCGPVVWMSVHELGV